MKKFLSLLAPITLFAGPCCMALDDPNCYTYAVNPPLVSNDCCVWGGRFDFLYWQPHAEGNPAAIIVGLQTNGGAKFEATPVSLDLQDYKYEYKAGFRIGIDAGWPCNEWRIAFNWTHYLHDFFYSNGVGSGTSTTSFLVVSPYLNANLTVSDSNLKAHWQVELEQADLVMNREFYVGHKVTLKPYGGLRALFLNQKSSSFNQLFFGNGLISESTATISTRLRNNFKGVGIVAGLASTWDMMCGLGLYGDFSTALLYGKNKSSLSGAATNVATTVALSTLESNYRPNVVRTIVDLAFGVQWNHFLLGDSNGLLQLKAGWELHQYFRQVNFANFSLGQIVLSPNANQSSNDLSFQGLVLSASFTY